MDNALSVVIVPNKLRFMNFIQRYLNPNTLLIQYRYDVGYNGILSKISETLNNQKVTNMAFLLYSTPFGAYICTNDGCTQRFSYDYMTDGTLQSIFFMNLISFFDANEDNKCRLDFLNCNLSSLAEVKAILTFLTDSLQVSCFISKDLWGNDIIMKEAEAERIVASNFYFLNTSLNMFTPHQTMNNFEKIRTVGKGAFGTAVLYRKKDDDSLVILKEINMHDLSATERQMAMNEVKVLSLLDHPNIVAYYDSFEEDGILIIEMEYADNGTLCQFLSRRQRPLEEKQIIELFQQIVSAINYIHGHKILHRDLKTANIFLTKEVVIKVGDFGISKMLTSNISGAHSVIGTPHYISPEMCEGKVYNEKSDVWSLGCILYEMTCLHKTFEGSNLPAIVNKIIKCQFEPVKGSYSDELKELILSMLHKNPEERSSTDIILYNKLPMMLKRFEVKNKENFELIRRDTRSVLYEMDITTLALTPVRLPSRIRIMQVCSSTDHVVVLTTDIIVYSWGNNQFGQLGLGDIINRRNPQLITSLSQKSLIRLACGSNFSIFGSENGIIMTCGFGGNGCLGHGDFKDVWKPKLIESLLSVDIISISATANHVIAVTSEGSIFGWGCNKSGQLGISKMSTFCVPQQIKMTEPAVIRNAFTSEDASIILTDVGALLASGNNYGNKLGLNARQGFLMTMKSVIEQPCVTGVHEFTLIKTLSRHRVNQVSMGSCHTIVICQSGKVISFGMNANGQLGNGHTKPVLVNTEIKSFKKCKVTKIASGSLYSIAYVNYNSLYLWGKRQLQHNTSEMSTSSNEQEKEVVNVFRSPGPSSVTVNVVEDYSVGSTTNISERKDDRCEIYTLPVLILHLKNSAVDNPGKELIRLTDCTTYGECNLLVQIDTTAPPPKKRKRRSRTATNLKTIKSSEAMASSELRISLNSRTSLNDSEDLFATASVPTWIRNELLDSVADENRTPSFNKPSDIVISQPEDIPAFKNSLRIYSSSDQSSQFVGNDKSFPKFSDSLCLNVPMDQSLRWNKSDVDFTSNEKALRDKELRVQLNNLRLQLQTQQHEIAKSTVLISKLQEEINRLNIERNDGDPETGISVSTICSLQ